MKPSGKIKVWSSSSLRNQPLKSALEFPPLNNCTHSSARLKPTSLIPLLGWVVVDEDIFVSLIVVEVIPQSEYSSTTLPSGQMYFVTKVVDDLGLGQSAGSSTSLPFKQT